MQVHTTIFQRFKTIALVFAQPRYSFVVLIIIFFVLAAASWLQNFHFLAAVLFSPLFPLKTKFQIFFTGFGALASNYSFPNAFFIVLLAVLTGVNFSMIVFYYKKRARAGKELGVGAFGALLGFLGIGCSTCGSVLISSFLGFGAAAGFLNTLPFNGLEFGIASTLLIIFSIFTLAKKIDDPLVCRIDKKII